MAKQALLNIKGEKVKDINLKDEIWNIEPNDQVLYDAVRLAMSSLRQGTHDTKNRDEVSGGGRKPWKQKGTGRARQGSTRAPHWRHGGIIFGPTPRDYSFKMNKKERRLAIKSALSYKLKDKELILIDELVLNSPKTKDMINILESLKLDDKVLFVTKELNDNVVLASRNIATINVIDPKGVNVLDVINSKYLVVTEEAVNILEEVLS